GRTAHAARRRRPAQAARARGPPRAHERRAHEPRRRPRDARAGDPPRGPREPLGPAERRDPAQPRGIARPPRDGGALRAPAPRLRPHRRRHAPAVRRAAARLPLDAYANREAARVQDPSGDERTGARERLEAALYSRPKDPVALRLYAAELDAAGETTRAADLFVRSIAVATD